MSWMREVPIDFKLKKMFLLCEKKVICYYIFFRNKYICPPRLYVFIWSLYEDNIETILLLKKIEIEFHLQKSGKENFYFQMQLSKTST